MVEPNLPQKSKHSHLLTTSLFRPCQVVRRRLPPIVAQTKLKTMHRLLSQRDAHYNTENSD
jgi:hypothetical protein